MSKEDILKFEGTVTEILPNNMFRVNLNENNLKVIAYLSGKMKQNRIKVIAGDRVDIEMTPYDLTRGRLTFRHR
jgi:translation initiation factor IF-1